MSPRKTAYNHIRFPINPKLRPGSLLALYLKEFGFIEPLGAKDVIVLYINIFSDFLEKRISSHVLSSFSFGLLTSLERYSPDWSRVKDPILRKLRSDILDCLDINWLIESESFNEVTSEMSLRLKEYSNYYRLHAPA